MSTVSTVSTVIARCYLHLRWYFYNTHPFLEKNIVPKKLSWFSVVGEEIVVGGFVVMEVVVVLEFPCWCVVVVWFA